MLREGVQTPENGKAVVKREISLKNQTAESMGAWKGTSPWPQPGTMLPTGQTGGQQEPWHWNSGGPAHGAQKLGGSPWF